MTSFKYIKSNLIFILKKINICRFAEKFLIMKKTGLLFVSIILIFNACTKTEDNYNIKKTPETEIEKVSYSFGLGFAFTLKNQGMDTIINLDYFSKAFHDVFQNDSLDISKEEGEKILDEYFDKIQQEIMSRQLSENRTLIAESQDGEIILASGLKIMIIESKDGLSPQLSDTVTTEILIKSLDGNILQEFPEPQTFVLSQVFPGLTEGIQLMSVGDKWNLTIPPELANGNGETIIFEVKLLKIN